MFNLEDFIRHSNSLTVIILVISLCALWFAYRSKQIAEKSYQKQRKSEKKQRKREKKLRFDDAMKSVVDTRSSGEKVVHDINKYLLDHTTTRDKLNSLYAIREETVHIVNGIEKLIAQMSLENSNTEIMDEVRLHSDEIEIKAANAEEIFDNNELQFI